MPANEKRRAARLKAGKAADYAAAQLRKIRRLSGLRPHIARRSELDVATGFGVWLHRKENATRPAHARLTVNPKKVRRIARAAQLTA